MFKNDLILKVLGENLWEVMEEFIWECNENQIIIEKGFITDLASVPKWVRMLPYLDPTGENRKPAVLHDWLYKKQTITRKQTDKLFRKALRLEKIPAFWAYLHYVGVRVGGIFGWNRNKKKLNIKAV